MKRANYITSTYSSLAGAGMSNPTPPANPHPPLQYNFQPQGGSPTAQLTPNSYPAPPFIDYGGNLLGAPNYNYPPANYPSGYFNQQHTWPEDPPYSSSDPYVSGPPAYHYPSVPSYPVGNSAPDPGVRRCARCGATSTPLWRREPGTQRSLCNACGLYAQQRHQDRPQALIDADAAELAAPEGPVDGPTCTHCGTQRTSVWRRNKNSELVCNACGCYERLNGRPRPVELRTNRVKPRAKQP